MKLEIKNWKLEVGNWKSVLMTIILAVAVLATQKVSAETVAYWRLEEGTSGSSHPTDLDGYFAGSSSYSNNMSAWYYPAPVSDVLLPIIPNTGLTNERALNFIGNGINYSPASHGQYLETRGGEIEEHAFTNGFTIECIAKARTYNWFTMVGKDGKPNSGTGFSPFKLLFRYDDNVNPKINFEFTDTATNVPAVSSTFAYNLDEWYCIAVVCDGNNASLYIKQESDDDYGLEGTVTVTGGIIDTTGMWAVARGMWDGVETDNLYGSVDEVRICDTALLPNQFLAKSGGAAVSPVAYWRFEEGTNGIHQANNDGYYKDSSGNGNDLSTEVTETRSTANTDVPFSVVPQTGKSDTMARQFSGPPEIPDCNVGTFGAETSAKYVESVDLSSFTVECMVKPSALTWMCPLSKDGEPGWRKWGWVDQTFAIKFRGDGPINFQFWDKNSNMVYIATSWNYEIDKWYQIAAVYNEYTGIASLYIKKEGDADYILEGSTTTCWTPGNPAISGGMINQPYPWTVGRGMHWGIPKDAFQGIVDEVRISDTALYPSQFLGNIMNTNPFPPEIYNAEYSPYPTPTEKDGVTVQAIIITANATITNATLEYSINGGGYVSVTMTTNTSPSIYSADIPVQVADTVIDYIVKAINSGGQTTASTSRYDVVQTIEWETVLVADNAFAGYGNNVFSMALKSDGLAGFVYSAYENANSNAMYVEEISRGVIGTPVAITTDRQGSYANLKYGTNDEPRVSLGYDVDDEGGVTFVQRSGGTWTTPIMVVTNFFDERRHVMTLVDDVPSILWYEDYQSLGYFGKFCQGNVAGDSFTSVQVDVPPYPNYPGDLRLPFEMKTDSEGKRCIALHGPGWGADLLYYGVEDSKGSGTFSWEEIPLSLTHSNVYADQIGFALDNNDKPYIVLHDYNTNPTSAVLFYKPDSTWILKYLGPQGHWNRAAVAYDSWNDCMWLVHNTEIVPGSVKDNSLLRLWSNRSGEWKTEQLVTNGLIVETFAGLAIGSNGVLKLAYSPIVDSPQFLYMYSTTFSDIPEPTIIFAGIALVLLAFRRK